MVFVALNLSVMVWKCVETVEFTLSSWKLMLIGFLASTVDKTYLEKKRV